MWREIGLMEKWVAEVGREPTPEMFIERYERHNERVLEHFRDRPSDLLVVCWEKEPDPWRRLCTFLGRTEMPSVPFPHENRADGEV